MLETCFSLTTFLVLRCTNGNGAKLRKVEYSLVGSCQAETIIYGTISIFEQHELSILQVLRRLSRFVFKYELSKQLFFFFNPKGQTSWKRNSIKSAKNKFVSWGAVSRNQILRLIDAVASPRRMLAKAIYSNKGLIESSAADKASAVRIRAISSIRQACFPIFVKIRDFAEFADFSKVIQHGNYRFLLDATQFDTQSRK